MQHNAKYTQHSPDDGSQRTSIFGAVLYRVCQHTRTHNITRNTEHNMYVRLSTHAYVSAAVFSRNRGSAHPCAKAAQATVGASASIIQGIQLAARGARATVGASGHRGGQAHELAARPPMAPSATPIVALSASQLWRWPIVCVRKRTYTYV